MDSGTGRFSRFFKHPTFEYVFLISLGRAYYLAGNVGKVLYLAGQIEDGNFESAYQAYKRAGDEARAIAEESEGHGHKVSARQAYLWAQNFYDSSTYFVDGSADPTRFLPTWELVYDCWLKAIGLFDPPIEAVRIPYENTELHGFFFWASGARQKRPLLILNNGSDGSLLDMWMQGGAGAVARGYHCLTFDGPGQGYALWKQQLFFRPDWEKVITPVVDYALSRPEVDAGRLALQGISQGGYWVPRAVAFESRIAAAVADPGVMDVSTSWTSHLPKPLIELLEAGRQAEFDRILTEKTNPEMAAALRFRMRPYGFSSPFNAFKAVQSYHLRDIVTQIRCPMLITAPAGETFWPGQSQELYDLLTCPKSLVPFSMEEGADLHCEPKAYGLRDLRVFDWLDETLG
ncbi:MAG TPA: prolyl oligopeptidase family serine peptidase [Chthoniobacterales bacterium]